MEYTIRWKNFRDTKYQVSDTGIVKRIHKKGTEKILKNNLDKDGYCRVDICKDGLVRHFHVHRLVAELFLPNFYNKPQVNHKDTIKSNNTFSNLEWCTSDENTRHASHNGLMRGLKGEENHQCKINREIVLEIRKIGLLKKHDLAKKYNINVTSIYDIVNRRSWKHI